MPRINRIFLNISSFQTLAMFRRGLFYSYLSIYLRFYLGLSVTETTLFATLPMVLNVLFQTFVWGRISDRYQSRRTLIIIGEFLAAVGTFFVWFFHTIPDNHRAAGYVIIIGLAIVEIFWSMSNVGWSALISDLYPEHKRAGIQGKLSSIGSIGRIIGVWIGGLAYDGLARYYEGWGFHKGLLFFIASGAMVLSTIPMFFVPEGGVGRDSGVSVGHKEGRFLDAKPFLVFLLAMLFINFGRNSVAVIKTQYLFLNQGFNVSSQVLSYIVNIQSVAMFIGGLIIARFTRWLKDRILLLIGTILALIYLLGFALAQNLSTIFMTNFLSGFSDVIILATSYSYASRLIPPTHRGRQFALFNATFFLSWGVAGTVIAGPVVDLLIKTGRTAVFSYRASFITAGLLVIAGIITLIFAYRLKKK